MARPKKDEGGVNADDALIGQGVAGFMNTGLYKQILKKYGPGAIVKASDVNDLSHFRLPTGILSLDYGLSGGVAVGRVTIFFGPKASSKTTTSLRVLASAQSRCARCWTVKIHPATGEIVDCRCGNYLKPVVAFINVEATWDKHWAECVGVNTEEILYSQPDFGEQAVDIMEALVDSGHVHVVLLDSLAFLVPTAEIEKEAEGFNVGDQARLIAKCVRKTLMAQGRCEREHGFRPTILMTNQISHKVGVMWGCFHEDTPVMFADGSQHRIRDVVEQKMVGPVLSWDTHAIVERPITAWHDNGVLAEDEHWLTFATTGTGGLRGSIGFTVTPNHVLVRADGREIRAKEAEVGDSLLSWSEESLTFSEKAVLLGSLFGDGHLLRHAGGTTAGLRLSNSEQPAYLAWKLHRLRGMNFKKIPSTTNRVVYEAERSYELGRWRQQIYGEGGIRKIPVSALQDASLLTLAVWFMDDGTYRETHRNASISVKRLTVLEGTEVANVLATRYPGVTYRITQRAVVFPTAAFIQFSKDIAEHVPGCMRYKLLPEHRLLPLCAEPEEERAVRRRLTPVTIQAIHVSERKHRARRKYDLTVDSNSYYLVGGDSRGVVVHNSPETTPGGFRPGFMASTEVRLAAKNPTSKEIDADVGAEMVTMEYRVVKQKTGVPFREGEFQLVTQSSAGKPKGSVYDEPQIVRLGEKSGLLTREGKTYTLLNKTFTRKEDIISALLEDPLYAYNAREAILSKLLEDPDEPQA